MTDDKTKQAGPYIVEEVRPGPYAILKVVGPTDLENDYFPRTPNNVCNMLNAAFRAGQASQQRGERGLQWLLEEARDIHLRDHPDEEAGPSVYMVALTEAIASQPPTVDQLVDEFLFWMSDEFDTQGLGAEVSEGHQMAHERLKRRLSKLLNNGGE